MDVVQPTVARRKQRTGWLASGLGGLKGPTDGFLAMHVSAARLPLALQGAAGGVASLTDPASFSLRLSGDAKRAPTRRSLLASLNAPDAGDRDDLTAFVRRRQVQTLRSVDVVDRVLR